jgi:simple sugar transport system permease protein
MRLELVKRPQRSALFSALSPFLAFVLTMIAGGIMFAALGINPFTAFYTYFISPISEVWQLHELTIKAAPLILIAVGLAVCYRANIWNIGAEGQFILGGIAGSIIPVMFPTFESPIVLPLCLLLGMVGGALYAAIPALLKTRFNTNEILTSLMLVYVAQLFLDWLVRGPWRNPQGNNFPETRRFHADAMLPELMPADGRANWGIVFAVVAAILVWVLVARTMKGFEVRVLGASPRAGRCSSPSCCRARWPAWPASPRCRARSGSSGRASPPATASPPSSSPSSDG